VKIGNEAARKLISNHILIFSPAWNRVNHAASKRGWFSRFPVNVGTRETGLLMFTHREEPFTRSDPQGLYKYG
jgi:hypothetical protein